MKTKIIKELELCCILTHLPSVEIVITDGALLLSNVDEAVIDGASREYDVGLNSGVRGGDDETELDRPRAVGRS